MSFVISLNAWEGGLSYELGENWGEWCFRSKVPHQDRL